MQAKILNSFLKQMKRIHLQLFFQKKLYTTEVLKVNMEDNAQVLFKMRNFNFACYNLKHKQKSGVLQEMEEENDDYSHKNPRIYDQKSTNLFDRDSTHGTILDLFPDSIAAPETMAFLTDNFLSEVLFSKNRFQQTRTL